MGRRYYCDYCDRSFKDDPEARKKHLSSSQHVKNRTEHYNNFKDPETILKEENMKTPCKRFMNYGDCAFGNTCKFSHYTPFMIWELQQYVAFKNSQSQNASKINWPQSNRIDKECFKDIVSEEANEEFIQPTWKLPLEIHNYPHLPPSLWPLTPDSITDSNFAEWGKPWIPNKF